MNRVSLMVLLLVSTFASGCGNNRFSEETNPVRVEDIRGATSGLFLRVRNSLPMEQIGSRRVQPHLNVYFCSPIPSIHERCTLLPGIARNGSTETYLVTREQLAAVYGAGGGYGSFEFTDDQQLSSTPWSCYTPNHQVALNSNFESRQDWEIEVNQRFLASYGCLLNRLN